MSNWQDLDEQSAIPSPLQQKNNWVDLPPTNVRPTAISAAGIDPERAAKDYELAQAYGATPSLVETSRKDFEERAVADAATKIMGTAPKLSQWYAQVPHNAALLKDDLQNPADLEKILGEMRIKPETPVPQWLKKEPKRDAGALERAGRAWKEGQAGNRIAAHGFIQAPLDGLSELFPSLFSGLAESNREEIRKYREWIQDSPFTEAKGGAGVWEDFVRTSPQMATQIAMGLLSGGVLAPTSLMGTQIAGSQYAELTEDGVSGGRAFLAALGNTAMQLPLEAIQMSKLMAAFKSSGLGRIARNVGEAALTSFVTETLQNYPEAFTTLWAKSTQTGQDPLLAFMDNIGEITREGMYEGVLSMPWALLGGSGRIAYDIGRYRTLNRDTAFFSSLDDNAAASKLKARLPQAYQNLVDHLTAGGPVQNLYISPAAMRSVISDENVLYQTANDLGVSREQFNRAEELGADIEVPLNLYQGKIAGTEASLALRGEIRTSPEGMTLAEQASFAEDFRHQVESAVSEYRDSLLQDDELNNILAPIESELLPIYGKEGARANVALLRARAIMAAQAWKEAGQDITPAQWLQDVAKLRVAVQAQGEAGDLQQAAIRAGDEALKRDAKAFAGEVDKVEAAKNAPSQNTVMLRQTPLVLRMIGEDVFTGKKAVEGGLYVSPHTFQNALDGRHGVTLDMLKQIPEAMADPIAIFDSASKRAKGDVVFMLELKDKDGKTVVVPVALQSKGQNKIEVNVVKSAYGKGEETPAVQWFIDQAKENARYVNGQKFERWQEDSGVQFSSGYANAHGNKIHTDADLVKLREGNPTLYQTAPPVDTPEFKAWFGDSKVVDESGKPLVVYHGTRRDFEAFEPSQPRGAIGNPKGIYFTELNHVAEEYSMDNDGAMDSRSRIVAAYLKIENDNDGIIRTNAYGEKEYIVFKPENIKSVHNRGTFDPKDPRILFQSAFTGSPHRFDKFSTEHIGSGEGAQAFGWGLYFSELKDIAEGYRKSLAYRDFDANKQKIGGKSLAEWNRHWEVLAHKEKDPQKRDAYYQAMSMLDDFDLNGFDREAILRQAQEDGVSPEAVKLFDGVAKEFKSPGQLYEVNLPENHELLDWDKELGEQPKQIREKLRELFAADISTRAVPGPNALVDLMYKDSPLGVFPAGKIDEAVKNFDKYLPLTGQSIYNILSRERDHSDRAASEYLNSLGIKGIRYLAGEARDRGEGAHNFVIFDDQAIETVRTYYQQKEAEKRGAISFSDNETLISLFKDSADFSTFIHEIGHLFIKDMENLVATGMAPAQVVKDLESLKAFTAEFADTNTLNAFYDNTFRKQRAEFQDKDFSSLSDTELALVRGVAEQEKLADAFVAYINEGKAPSMELLGVFRRFRAWLQKLYQSLSGQVAINDEIRGVFDRMLASEQDIRLAERIHQGQAAELQALNAVAAEMLTEQEQAKLQKARQEAAAASREQRIKKALQAYYRAKANRNEIRKQAAETVGAMPVYAAQDQAIAEGGVNYEAVREVFGDDVAKALLKKRPGFLRKEGDVSLSDLAIAHGFANEEALVDAIRNAPGKQTETQSLIKAEIAAREEVIRKELGLDEGANSGDLDYFSDERLESLEMEARALSRATAAKYQRETQKTETRQKFDAAPTAEVTGTEIFDADKPFPVKIVERRNAVVAWLQSRGWLKSFTNTETGWDIKVSRQSIRDTAGHGMGERKAQVLAALPNMLENAIYLEEGKTTDSGSKRHIFASKVRVGDELLAVGIVIEEDTNGRRFYNHELTTIENLGGTIPGRTPDGGSLPENSQGLSVMNIVRKHLGVNPDVTPKARFATAETMRVLGRRMVESMPYREGSNIGRLSVAEAKQAARAAKALADGDMDAAADAKRRQAINHSMVLEALNYRHEAEVFTRSLKRYVKSERMVFDYQEQIRALAQRYKLAPGIGPRKPDERANLRVFIDSVTADSVFEAPPFSDFILSERVPENMTLGEMREVRDVARWLASEGNPEEARLLSEGVDGTLADIVKTGVETLRNSGNKYSPQTEKTAKRAAQDFWKDLFAGLDHTKFMLMAADGYTEIGKHSHLAGFHSQWFGRVMESQNKFFSMFRAARPELDRIAGIRRGFIRRFEKQFSKRAEEINGVHTPEVMREIGRTHWTAEHIWCLARNMGNAGNLKTLHEGLGLTDADLRALTAVLSKDEWLAIQAEGALVGKHFAETDAVFRKIYGRPMPDKVEPLPFTVVTAEGELLDLPGWYFPISTDSRLNPDVGDRQEIDLAKANPEFVAYGPAMAKSFSKSRTGTGRAVGLYFGVLDTGLQDQWRFMAMAPVIRDMDRITRNPEWRKAYDQAFGPEYYRELRAWLKYVARPVTKRGDRLDSFFNSQRKLATIFTLGLNTNTFIRQFQGYFQAVPDLGVKWMLKGIARAAHNPMALVRHINEQSPFLADRDKNFVRELRKKIIPPQDVLKVPVGEKTYTREDVQEVAMSLVTLGDRLTTYPIWQGAYTKAVESLDMGHKDAVAYADSLIQKTQATSSDADLNRWQREDGKSLKRLFTMFMSEALRKGSRMRYYWRAYQNGSIGIGEYVWHLSMESVAPAMFYVGMKALMTSSEPDPEDIAEQIFNELAGPLPLISQTWSAMRGYGSMTDSPVFRGIKTVEELGKNIGKFAQHPTSSAAHAAMFKSLVDATAFTVGAGNVRRVYETAAQGWHDLERGKTANPFRLFFRAPRK